MTAKVRYVIITPVRDEEQYIEQTLKSVIAQTITPIKWIIVNDGSSDDTGNIIDEYATRYPWIRTIHRPNRGFRKAGGGVIEAFYDGYDHLKEEDWEYLVKLDGDLSFEKDYFEMCFKKISDDPKLGIAGGMIYYATKGKLELERNPLFHVRGATKIYRRDCWNAIGKLIESPGWDTLDEVKASMLGWETRSFVDLQVIHHRHTGAADGTWGGYVKDGRADYISGYHPLFMAIKCLRRAFRRPLLVGALGLLYGFVSGYIKRIPQVEDSALINYLRRQQMNRILMKESIWK
jgi:biofilm PGA synthesis N-glycosyltransferase PgaC